MIPQFLVAWSEPGNPEMQVELLTKSNDFPREKAERLLKANPHRRVWIARVEEVATTDVRIVFKRDV